MQLGNGREHARRRVPCAGRTGASRHRADGIRANRHRAGRTGASSHRAGQSGTGGFGVGRARIDDRYREAALSTTPCDRQADDAGPDHDHVCIARHVVLSASAQGDGGGLITGDSWCLLPAPALPGSGSTVGGSQQPSQPSPLGSRAVATIRAIGTDLHGVASISMSAGQWARAGFAQARLYLCTDARQRQGDLDNFLDAVLAGGVDIVQLRQKGLEARDELRFLESFAAAAERHGKLFAVNDRADIARACRAPILHLGQDDLPVAVAREIVGEDPIIGRSTHSPAQFDAAIVEHGVDYACVGPTWVTPTKPGRPAAGVQLIDHAAAATTTSTIPWYAIGGIEDLERLDDAMAHGARRVVVVRAITEAEDPGAAARTFAKRLTAVV